jgi:hypothetical protein
VLFLGCSDLLSYLPNMGLEDFVLSLRLLVAGVVANRIRPVTNGLIQLQNSRTEIFSQVLFFRDTASTVRAIVYNTTGGLVRIER